MSDPNQPAFNLNLTGSAEDIYRGRPSAIMFEGVMPRRVLANIFDLIALLFICLILSIPFFFLGILTFGLLFFFYGLYLAAIALTYITLSLGGENSATPGMRALQIEMRTSDGFRPTRSTAFVHGFLFFAFNSIASPLILLVGLFNRRGRLAHDFLTGTVLVNTSGRIDQLQRD